MSKSVIVFRTGNFTVREDKPVILIKYMAAEHPKSYMVTRVLEPIELQQHWLPKLGRESDSSRGTCWHGFKNPLDALAHAEGLVLDDIQDYEDKLVKLKIKLGQIAKLKLRHTRIEV